MKCKICNTEDPSWEWTDTHGVAQCSTCGTPYRLLHYKKGEDGNNVQVKKAPTCCLKSSYIPAVRRYWAETKSTIPGGHSFPGGQELATPEEKDLFFKWMRTEGKSSKKQETDEDE